MKTIEIGSKRKLIDQSVNISARKRKKIEKKNPRERKRERERESRYRHIARHPDLTGPCK